MIELINQDYADFVNLSTNLVGLDKNIQQELTEPLRTYRDQVTKLPIQASATLADTESH